MKYCKDCVHCTPPPPRTKKQAAAGDPPHTGWLCDAVGFNVVTGTRMTRETQLCANMRAGTGPCGNPGLLFSKR